MFFHIIVLLSFLQWMGSGRPGEVGHPAVFPVVEAFDKELVNVPVHNHNTEATSVKGKPLRMNFAMETYVLVSFIFFPKLNKFPILSELMELIFCFFF